MRSRVLACLAAAASAAALLSAPAAVATPQRGCGAPPQDPGTSALHTIESGGLQRTYQLHLPEDYQRKRDCR